MLHVWNIYLHLPQNGPHVGKYSSTMGHLGNCGKQKNLKLTNPTSPNSLMMKSPMVWWLHPRQLHRASGSIDSRYFVGFNSWIQCFPRNPRWYSNEFSLGLQHFLVVAPPTNSVSNKEIFLVNLSTRIYHELNHYFDPLPQNSILIFHGNSTNCLVELHQFHGYINNELYWLTHYVSSASIG